MLCRVQLMAVYLASMSSLNVIKGAIICSVCYFE